MVTLGRMCSIKMMVVFFIDIIKIFVNPICSFSRMTSLIGVGELALAKVGDCRGQEVKSSPRMHESQVSAGLG